MFASFLITVYCVYNTRPNSKKIVPAAVASSNERQHVEPESELGSQSHASAKEVVASSGRCSSEKESSSESVLSQVVCEPVLLNSSVEMANISITIENPPCSLPQTH